MKDFYKEWLKMYDVKESEIGRCRFTGYQMTQFAEAWSMKQNKELKDSNSKGVLIQIQDQLKRRNYIPIWLKQRIKEALEK
jgi:hypothetical protein